MAVAACKECGHQVAESAPSCPSCGVTMPGVSNQKIAEVITRVGFFQHRWIAGVAFWPGIVWLLLPLMTGGEKEAFIAAWGVSKWLIGFGVLWYVANEIERNLFERKVAKEKAKDPRHA